MLDVEHDADHVLKSLDHEGYQNFQCFFLPLVNRAGVLRIVKISTLTP